MKGLIHIDRLLETAIRRNASDLYLTVERPPVLRVNGRLRQLETKVLEPKNCTALMKSITPDRNQQELQEEGGTDFGFAFGDAGRFRVSVFRQKGNVSIVLRLIPSRFLSFEEIGLPTITKALCRRPRGLFLVTGPTGSGKTTTLASMINYINHELDRHIVTIEDPIEYYHTHKKSLINQREVGSDVPSFAEAIRRSVRQGTDVIVVGQLEDAETIQAVLDAAASGVLVFAHMQSVQGVAKALDHLVDRFPTERQNAVWRRLADLLICAIYQVLCTGVKHVVPASEFTVVTPATSEIIRESRTSEIDEAIRAGGKYGMRLLDDELYRLFETGEIAADVLLDMARHPGEIQEKLNDDPDNEPLGNRVPDPSRGPPPSLEGHADANGT